jgi:hypothetical protein
MKNAIVIFILSFPYATSSLHAQLNDPEKLILGKWRNSDSSSVILADALIQSQYSGVQLNTLNTTKQFVKELLY